MQPARLPALLETSITLARLVLVLVGAVVTVRSLMAGATWWDVALRGGSALLALGLLLWALNWHVAHGLLRTLRLQLEEVAQETPGEGGSEWRA